MLYSPQNGTIAMDGTTMDYIRFGTGSQILIMLPGLGDGLRTMKGTALPMAIMYRVFAGDFTVYAFSRKAVLPRGCSTRDMARDLKTAMDLLGIEKAHLFGVSMGGMIAQHFAADYPQAVEKLILAVTCARPNPVLEASIREWIGFAEQHDHTALMQSNLRRIYSEGYCRKNGYLVPLIGKLTKPKSYDRFFVQARACLTHDAFDRLPEIQANTLVIGGGQDKTLGAEPSREIAAAIPGAHLKMYPLWGHGVYEEAPDFNKTIHQFLTTGEGYDPY